jgi:hypothetical protein
LSTRQLADLVARVQEVVGPWETPPVGRPHVLALPAAVVAVLFGLLHNIADDVVSEVFGCSQATITRYHDILQPVLRWVTRPEVDRQLAVAQRAGVLVDGFVAPVGEREHDAGLFSGKKHVSGHNVQVVADLDGRVADVQKAYNYSVNRLRAAVERAISHLKNWKILKTGYHRIMTDSPDVLRTVTGLEIFTTATQGFE